ncbi:MULTISPECIES: (2Fe-2S)-binding protein [Cycloclasticus]|uniref:(2Fe-2S)-binding protein n=1 Tax=Cycloclasticus TaxID=34067 RepID=UPI0003713C4C|nr:MULTISPECIES: (2Fe-2S)-binding protein [Cycloclasticus]MBV1898442.1 (2Fe-2S)-binding protein [Cycloclasticus sp.]MDF1829855.1 (2Fe-2S)-binding protein [Cycloclasticus pugetii]
MAYEFKDDDVICSCTGVTKKHFLTRIKADNIETLEQAREKTHVNVACGMCVYIVEKLLDVD